MTLEQIGAEELDGLWRLYVATDARPTFKDFNIWLVENGYIND